MLGAETAAGSLGSSVTTVLRTFSQRVCMPVVLRDWHAGQEIEALWQEYEDGQTAEAVMVKDFDKVSAICLKNSNLLWMHDCDLVPMP